MNKKKILLLLATLFLSTSITLFAYHAATEATPQQEQGIDGDKVAERLYQRLKHEYPEESDDYIYQIIGLTFFSQEKMAMAERYLKKAVEINPKLYWSWYNLGLIYIHTEEGYNYFKKATEANPEFSIPYYWMAYYKCGNRQDDKAISLFKKYLEIAEKQNDPQEERRMSTAREVLSDLLSGEEGKNLRMMRLPAEESLSERFHQKTSQIRSGLTPEEVKDILGEPDSVDQQTDIQLKGQDTIWVYQHPVMGPASYIVIFRDGKVALSSFAAEDIDGGIVYIKDSQFYGSLQNR